MRSFWTEFLTAAASHPFPAIPGDILTPLDLERTPCVSSDSLWLLVKCEISRRRVFVMRISSLSWSRTAECLKECAWQSLYCGLEACQKLTAAHHLLSQPYPSIDVVIAAPTIARHR
ncbi:unnamed protein product, partial [Iphiclides podalirius]